MKNKNLKAIVLGTAILLNNPACADTNMVRENVSFAIQNAGLCYYDLFTQTKFALNLSQFTEQNPISKVFLEKNLFGLKYFLNLGAIAFANYSAYKIDKTGRLAKLINTGLSLTQAVVILSNDFQMSKYLKNIKDKPQLNLNFPLIVYSY